MIRRYLLFLKLKRQSAPSPAFVSLLKRRLMAEGEFRADSFIFSQRSRLVLVLASVILLMGFGTTSYAYASPSVTSGHPLYSLKTGVEKMESKFQHTPEARAYYQVKLFERRASEAGYVMDHGGGERALPHLRRLPADFSQARLMLRDQSADRAAAEERLIYVLLDFRQKVLAANLTATEKAELLDLIDTRLTEMER